MNTHTNDDASASDEDNPIDMFGSDHIIQDTKEDIDDIPLIYAYDPDQRLPLLGLSAPVSPISLSGRQVRSFLCTPDGTLLLYRRLGTPPTGTEIDIRHPGSSAGFENSTAAEGVTSDKLSTKSKEIDWSWFDISRERRREFGYNHKGEFMVIDHHVGFTESLVQQALETLNSTQIGQVEWLMNHGEGHGRINFGKRSRWKFQSVPSEVCFGRKLITYEKPVD